MEQERSAYLFDKYVNKTCTPAEFKEFMAIVRNADDQTVLDLLMDNFWNQSQEAELHPAKADLILDQVLSASGKRKPKMPEFSIQWLGWAAAFLIVCLATFFLHKNTTGNSEKPVKSASNITQHLKSLKFVTVKTVSQHQKITLPDGSTVILNNHSSITFPKAFGNQRTVVLAGEGYFDIKHDAKKSFTVLTGKLSTTVLGTAFNIKAYDSDHEILVTVTRGKVSVLDNNAVLAVLTPNQQMVFNKGHKQANLAHVVAKNVIQWQESDIFFDDISLDDAAQILSRRFNTTITVDNVSAKKCRFTATFLKGESLDQILKIICAYNNAQYQTSAGGITIKGEGCD